MPLDRLLRHLIAWQSADGPPVPDRELTIEQARERYRANAAHQQRDKDASGPAVTSADRLIEGPDGAALGIRVYTPEPSGQRVVTFLHGGGWVLGDLDSHDRVCRAMAASLGAVVVAVDYRRAPEFPYPAPLHDAVTAARWTARSFPGRAHVIAGDSAGASLSLGVVLQAHDVRFAAQLLVYPPVDPSLMMASAGEHSKGCLLSVEDMVWNYAQYVPDPRRRSDPAVDLLRADFRNLPPTVVATAEYDPLHDEGVELVARMRAAGVAVRHVPGEGLVHGYFLMQGVVPAATACARRVIGELDTLLDSLDEEAGAGPPRGSRGER
ncbi:alpha/beta hydrolase [Streptomyces rishiriensis]|uniref:Acetyl esterase n=1 Tax=Streptomyces rishiriensis TaxID=68264 RepID=A0ABU0P1R3_STRRH|nr:alpha/beta hydrolase [Streptomyces rishiriensis]MDQ0585333.1 acetyl esterase [Streptomyces rishiriensis]